MDQGSDGIECLFECNGGVMAFIQPKEAVDLCKKIIKVSADTYYA